MSNSPTKDTVPPMPSETSPATPMAAAEPAAAPDASIAKEAASLDGAPNAVRRALALVEQHPLRALGAVAAAAALIELEFALGALAGIGATALLATRSGADARRDVLAAGKRASSWARSAFTPSRHGKGPSEQAQH